MSAPVSAVSPARIPVSDGLPPLVEPRSALSSTEIEHYSRNIMLPEIGSIGQRRLSNARVLVIGAGGLGSPALLYLAAAGVGTIGIIDDDVVDPSNLQRQVVHGATDVGRSKVASASDTIAAINPHVTVEQHPVRLDSSNALDLFSRYDLILDGADNFATRYLANDAAAILGKPYVWGAVLRFTGQVTVFWEKYGPTYRDLFPEPPEHGTVPSCGEAGVLGIVCAAIGSAMAAEAIKLITGIGQSLLGRLQLFDALTSTWREIAVRKDDDAAPITELIDYEGFCGMPPRDATPASSPSWRTISVQELDERLRARNADGADFDLIDVREPSEYALVNIPGSRLIPLAGIQSGDALADLQRDRELVVYCKTGIRSTHAVEALGRAGYTQLTLVSGGILEWIDQVEPDKPRY
ncbi:MAG: sulfur-carrier protein adenylyltransferase/sulfurtransferase [Microbacteriaceae bacterium]|nr:sulfur-carrier protein adenylyltransferase/sulfurtransferase [Microbacteriaceae bacterium]